MSGAGEVTAVIPAKDEAPTIARIIRESRAHAGRVIVVDGHSRDATVEVSREAGAEVLVQSGRGKGAAIRSVIPELTSEAVVFLDADGSHDPADIPRLVAPILAGEADHVGGSRLIGGSSELHGGLDEFFRLAGSSLITAAINYRFRTRLSDSQNGFRALRVAALKELDLREDITTIEQEMLIKSLRHGLRVTEVPSHEYRREQGDSHIVLWRVAPRYVYSLIRYLLLP